MAHRRLEGLSVQETRQRVNRVMEDWHSYPDFASLFAALLAANDVSDRAFAQQYSQATHSTLSESEVNRIRHGAIRPSYRWVANIADYALLSLDPERAQPGGDHRLALFAAAGLAVEDGILPLVAAPSASRFSAQLGDLLGRLHQAGISQRQLVARTIPLGQTEPELSTTTLSMWKHGRTRPTMATLRALLQALERCQDRAHRPLVTADEIRQLVSAAGFSRDDLAATTHDIVARINGATQLKPLLSALRNAVDLNVAMPAIDSATARGQADNGVHMVHLLKSWECEVTPNSPTPAQVGELLTRYNRLLRAAGKAELSSEEMQKVVEVAQRDREDGQQRGFLKRVQERRPPSPRCTIRPDFDGGQGR